MNLPFRAIISDLDGTLLNTEHRLSRLTIKTLEQLNQLGVEIFLATGRNYPDVKHIVANLNINDVTMITSNGARSNNLAGNLFSQHYIPEILVTDIFRSISFDPSKVCLNSYQGDNWFINKDIPELKNFYQDSGFCYQVINFSHHPSQNTEKIFFISRKPSDLLPIEQQLKAKYADQLQIAYSTTQCLEIMAKDVCKANALSSLIANRRYQLSDCIAFGDGMNDLEMLSFVGKGIIMGNADPRLKNALPHLEVIGENKNDAVAHYLRHCFQLD